MGMTFNPDAPITKITETIIGAAIDVHRELGPGLLESAYSACLAYQFVQRRLRFVKQVPLAVTYRDVHLDCGYRLDFIVEESVVVEVKSVDRLAPIHSAQVITYLKLTGCPVGLLMNFNVTALRVGLRRLEVTGPDCNVDPMERIHREFRKIRVRGLIGLLEPPISLSIGIA